MTETIELNAAIKLLDAVESFLVRRAICGIEPTGLHAVFRKLWSDMGGNTEVENMKDVISGHKTVTWPSDDQVREAIASRPLYGSAILPFLVREYDRHLGGDVPADMPWMEHILPQTLTPEWRKVFSNDDYRAWVNTLANLIPLSSKMDQQIQNREYAHKRQRFLEDAMYKSARHVAKEYEDWTPTALADRASKLGSWAVERWKTS